MRTYIAQFSHVFLTTKNSLRPPCLRWYKNWQNNVCQEIAKQRTSDDIFDSINPKTRNLYIFDDMMGERDAVIAKFFTKKSHHGNLSVIYIVQNLFHQSKDHRTISLHASYIALTKNVRDASQVIHLAKQIYPN